MIEISGLSKTYGGKQALDDVSFRAEQGKVTALIGSERCRKDDVAAHPARVGACQ